MAFLHKYKVRFVVRGFTFIFERDFIETFAPVTQVTSTKMFYLACCKYGFETQVYGVKAAYLNADIDREIWVSLPKRDSPLTVNRSHV